MTGRWTYTSYVLTPKGVMQLKRELDPDDEDDRELIEAYLRGERE